MALAVALVAVSGSVSQAATVTYSSKTAFLSAVGSGVQLESFEDGKPTEWQATGSLQT